MSLSEPFDVVLLEPTDPAIDADKMLEEVQFAGTKATRIAAYVQTRDVAHLAFREGAKPVRYRVRPVRARELNALVADLAAPTGDELWSLVQRCLVSIDGAPEFKLSDDDFVTIDAMRSVRALKDAAMDRVAEVAGLRGVREIGGAILRRGSVAASALAPFALPRG